MRFTETFQIAFEGIQEQLDKEQEVKEAIKETVKGMEKQAKEIQLVLQKIYNDDGLEKIGEVCQSANVMFAPIRDLFATLESKVPIDQYYKYNELWRFTLQRLIGLAAFLIFLEKKELLSRSQAAVILGVKDSQELGFHIDLDDLMFGWLYLADDLPRLSVHCATFGMYDWSFIIAEFTTELDSKFRLLSSKGESLRKKLDNLKFHVKKVSEIVYDLSIRGLKKGVQNPEP